MQMEKKEPATTKPPSICQRLQKAFHTRPAFQPLRRLTLRHHDGGTATPATANGGPLTPVPPPPTPVPPLAANTLGSIAPPLTPTPAKPVADKVDKPHQGKQVPASSPSITATTTTEKVTMTTAAGMPMPAPPPGVAGGGAAAGKPANVKGTDNDQNTKGKSRTGSRVRKTLSSK